MVSGFGRKNGVRLAHFLALVSIANLSCAQQSADTTFAAPVPHPAFAVGKGPVVLLDEAHGNFHTATGRYRPFAEFLRRDGYVVQASTSTFTRESLRAGSILVIANALAASNQSKWELPTPSAFTDSEIVAVHDWVAAGGALLLISDHMPFPGAAEKLGAAFGARWSNGFALAKDAKMGGPFVFRRADHSLADHAIMNGRSVEERIDSVATFTGSAFQVDSAATPLLVLGPDIESVLPQVAWEFKSDTPRISVAGWPQAAVLRTGRGYVALFGEAAMFSAQVTGPKRSPMGMNAPIAAQNPQLLLNVVHWLSGLLDS